MRKITSIFAAVLLAAYAPAALTFGTNAPTAILYNTQAVASVYYGTNLVWSGASAPWYLSGGVPPTWCVAAYAFKGASSSVASLSNLVSSAYPMVTNAAGFSWAATNGWTYTPQSYPANGPMSIAIAASNNWSMVVCFTNFQTSGAPIVCGANGNGIYTIGGTAFVFANGTSGGNGPGWWTSSFGRMCQPNIGTINQGRVAIYGSNVLVNGVSYTMTNNATMANGSTGLSLFNAYGWGNETSGKISSFALFNQTLTTAQAVAIVAAMP